jgi:hypothetical protein
MIEYLRVIHYNNKIRLGNKGDGGYVIANTFDYDCYISAGIGGDESFSNDVINHFNIKEAHGFDGTINILPQNSPKNMNFYKMNIASYQSNNTVNLRKYINNFKNIFLKMDIEGHEFEWLNSLSLDDLKKFKQITIEMHGINDNGWGVDHQIKINCIKKLFKTHYIIHVHGNNNSKTINNIPDVIEITYIRKDVIGKNIEYNKIDFPIKDLDFPNDPNKIDIPLNFHPFKFNNNMTSVFTHVYETNLWGNNLNINYNGSSGPGSDIDYNKNNYVPFLKKFIIDNNIKNIVDLGCGDFKCGNLIYNDLDISYIGYDTYKKIIDYNSTQYLLPKYSFFNLDFCNNKENIKTGDLCILKDVIQHWSLNNIYNFLDYLTENKKFKYILICNCCDQLEDDVDIIDGDCRGLSYNFFPLKKYNSKKIYTYNSKELSLIVVN